MDSPKTSPIAENPFETPSPRGIRRVQATLRVVVAIQLWGGAAGFLHHHQPFAFLEMLQTAYEIPPADVAKMADYIAYGLIGAGWISLLRPVWLILIPVLIWQTGTAVACVVQSQGAFSNLEPMLQATQMAAPLALLLVDFWPPQVRPTLTFSLIAVGCLRLATAIGLIGGGILTLMQLQNGESEIVDRCLKSAMMVFQKEIEVEQLQRSLFVVGVADIVLAMSLLSSRNRLMALIVVIWNLLQISTFTFAYQADGYDETLRRIAEVGAPLTVLLFWMSAYREQKPIILPEEGGANGAARS